MNGYPVDMGDEVYYMGEDYDILVKRESYTVSDDGERTDNGKVYLRTNMSVSHFINKFGRMTEDQSVSNVAVLALNNVL